MVYVGLMNINQKQDKQKNPELTEAEKREIASKQKENREKYEKISLEFKKSDEEKYGPEKDSEKMNVEKFKSYIYSFGKCKTEGRLTIIDSRTHQIYYDFHRLSCADNSGEDALSSIRVMLADRIANPFLTKRQAIFDIPFEVEYRELNGKRYVALSFSSRNGEKIVKQEFYIREN